MRIAILRRAPKTSVSMDVYADGLISGLKSVRPDWTISEYHPAIKFSSPDEFRWFDGVKKYQEQYWRYPSKLSHIEADVFHTIDHSDGYLSRWLRRTERLNVVTCHDLINLAQPDVFKGCARFPRMSMALWKWAVEGMHQADRVVTVSAYTKQDAIKYLGIAAQDITVIPNAVDKAFRPLPPDQIQSIRRRYQLSIETFCLFNIGSSNPRKNILTILAVVAELKKQEVPIHFFKAGVDFNSAQKQFIHSHDLTSHVSYVGQVDQTTLIELYNAADCLLAPSVYEGFGFTILEAMASGTPVITANVTAMPEVAGDAAILVDPLNVEEITQAVRSLYTHPGERQSLVGKGLERSSQFTWQSTAEQVARVYEQVYEQARSPTTSFSFKSANQSSLGDRCKQQPSAQEIYGVKK